MQHKQENPVHDIVLYEHTKYDPVKERQRVTESLTLEIMNFRSASGEVDDESRIERTRGDLALTSESQGHIAITWQGTQEATKFDYRDGVITDADNNPVDDEQLLGWFLREVVASNLSVVSEATEN